MTHNTEKTGEEAATPGNRKQSGEFESNGQLEIDEGQRSQYRNPFDTANCQEQMQVQRDG